MPRGVYPRKKKEGTPIAPTAKAPKAAKLTKAVSKLTATELSEKVETLPTKQYDEAGSFGFKSYDSGPRSLYDHLGHLTQARLTVNSQPAGHNEKLLSVLDEEIMETISSLKAWRQAAYAPAVTITGAQPAIQIAAAEDKPAQAVAVPAVERPAPPPAPVATPAPAPTAAVPPLPFTPQAVQEVMKHQA